MPVQAEGGTSQLPLKGVVLCSTALSQDARTQVAALSTEMGATHLLDLTYEVTHLIVASLGSPKYNWVARERTDIKILLPAWLDAVRESWVAGEDVNVAALEDAFRVPTFYGLHLCVTGFTDTKERAYLEATIKEQGAEYHGDLTKQVTHLVARVPEGSKYTAAVNWGVKVVGLKWFEDCLRRGMTVEEKLYDPTMPVEQQGVGAWKEVVRPRTSLGKRGRDSSQSQGVVPEGGKKKLRRTASTRLESQSQDLLQGFSVRDSISAIAKENQWSDGRSVSDMATSTTAFEGSDRFSAAPEQPVFKREEHSERPRGLFTGMRTVVHGFGNTVKTKLTAVLENNGATVIPHITALESDTDQTFSKCPTAALIVPHATEVEMPSIPAGCVVATEWWVERCIHHKDAMDPSDDYLSQPLYDVKIADLGGVTINSTGFTGVDLRQFAETVNLTGAIYQESLEASTKILVSGSDIIKQEKATYASKKGMAVVSAAWFWASLRARTKAPLDEYRVQLPALDPSEGDSQSSASTPVPVDRQPRPSFTTRRSEPPTRLSNTRRKHATPSLSLQASRPASRPTRGAQPFVLEDSDDDEEPAALPDQYDGTNADTEKPTVSPEPTSQGLKEINPNASPHKHSQHYNDAGVSSETITGLDIPDQPVDVKEQRPRSRSATLSPKPAVSQPSDTSAPDRSALQARMAAVLQSRQQQPSSASPTNSISPSKKRKQRPLGRAASSITNRSFSNSIGQQLGLGYQTNGHDDERDGGASSATAPAPPSTQLGYETLETEAHRLQMGKKMGLAMDDEESGGKRVASLGKVKDGERKDGKGKAVRRSGRN